MDKYDAVVIGDVNIDLIVAGCDTLPQPGQEVFVRDMTLHVGGGAALFSMTLAKLGMNLAFNGIVGDDPYGEYLIDEFKRYGIDTRYIKRSKHNNTGISIAINPEQDRSFITYSGSNAELSLEQLDMASVAKGRHVHLTGYKGSQNHSEFIQMVRKLQTLNVTTSLDTGWDDTGKWYDGVFELMGEIDVFFMNETEALHYSGCGSPEECLKLMSKHSNHFIMKLGSQGAAAIVNGKVLHSPGFIVDVVDTTGAGDSFNAGYIYGYLTGKGTEQCLIYGNACGALSVGAFGGSTGTVNLEGLERFIQLNQDKTAG